MNYWVAGAMRGTDVLDQFLRRGYWRMGDDKKNRQIF